MPSIDPVDHPSFDRFVAIIAALRAPDGCPWDREQTHASIAHNMIEEAYEAVDAIERGDTAHVREELGDVLLQVVLQSQIAADSDEFDIDDVCAEVSEKMVRRHPHVFGEAQAANASEVLDLWDRVKLAERSAASTGSAGEYGESGADGASAQEGASALPASEGSVMSVSFQSSLEGLLDGVPTSFPALMQAQKISRKAASAGFEWDSLDDVWDKVREEIGELREAYAAAPKAGNGKVDANAAYETARADIQEAAVAAVEEELGDVLFSLVNVGRRMGVDAESALRATCGKVRRRWAYMESAAQVDGRSVEELAAEEREALWEEAKKNC